MDSIELARLDDVLKKNAENAEDYLRARKKAAEAKYALDVVIGAGFLSGELSEKISYDKALIITVNEKGLLEVYKDLILQTSVYKGLEKVLEANADQIRWAQSKMKWQETGEGT